MGGKTKKTGKLRRLWRDGRTRILFWTSLVACLFGVLDLGQPIEQILLVARNSVRQHSASGNVVVVAIDDRALTAMREVPWPRRYHGKLLDRLNAAGARNVAYDFNFSLVSTATDDGTFADALRRSRVKPILALTFEIDPLTGKRIENYPEPLFRAHAALGNINVPYLSGGAVWQAPYAISFSDRNYPSFAALLGGRTGPPGELFPIDYALDPRTIPTISALDVLEGRVPAAALRGKDVLVGATATQLNDVFVLPGYGRLPGVYLHALAIETLREARPISAGWMFPTMFALFGALLCLRTRRLERAAAGCIVGVVILLFAPFALEARHIYVSIVPGLELLIASIAAHSWTSFRRAYRDRATLNPITGLPNLSALRRVGAEAGAALVAARVQNYAQVCAALPTDDERTLAEQIASRLTIGATDATVYQGDEGIFAWFASGQSGLDEHLGALHALFRSPVAVGDRRFDLSITFGVDSGAGRSIASRLGGALAAAEEAAGESRRWKRYDHGDGDDAAWRLSILSQLDAAIDAGDLWVAYQAKVDVGTRQAIGAEALVRWTHPIKGEISPMEFIPAAEQSGRIEKVTEFVLDRAIRAGSLAIQRCPGFNISVNLSPKLLGAFPLEEKVLALLRTYGLPPECLTLEVTETATLARAEADLAPLHRLRARGVQISIDDYGTGLSTLDYIKRLPAGEIKIDKSFVQAVGKSHSDRLMVHSTIQLAHSLGHKVVAEGVEDLATFETLAAMGCDIVQGFYFGKPMSFSHLTAFIPGWRKTEAA
jgi:EAL domain-containing protein (putative c-di-GMP-specific phosphodiesterase class I)/CHASE2 domain-containing sensor protein